MSESAMLSMTKNTGPMLIVLSLLIALSFVTELAKAETLEVELRIRDHLFFSVYAYNSCQSKK